MIDTLNAVKFAVCATNFIQNYFYVNWKFGIKFVRGTIFTTVMYLFVSCSEFDCKSINVCRHSSYFVIKLNVLLIIMCTFGYLFLIQFVN